MTRFRISLIHYLSSTLVVLGFGDGLRDERIGNLVKYIYNRLAI